MMRCRQLTAGALVGIVFLLSIRSNSADDDPWAALRAVRETLTADSPLAANFLQTYVPAGFSSGEQENGRLFLALPDCLRWDYEDPYPRSYLLCDRTVWAWSPDEPLGDRFEQVSREEAGLDFLLLSADRLAERYTVDSTLAPEGEVVLTLEPLEPEAPFQSATIRLDPETKRPLEIAYTDREGNETRFELTLFRSLEDTAPFSPPSDIEWIDG